MRRLNGRTTDPIALLEIAHALATHGCRVFPVDHAKKPLISNYHGETPFSAFELRRMPWKRASAVGVALPPGHIALDVDVKNSKSGLKHLEQLQQVYGALPPTLSQVTRSGGRHMVFALDPEEITQFRSQVALPVGGNADIDIVTPGYRYLVIYDVAAFLNHDGTFPEMPPAWYPALGKRSSPLGDTTPVLAGADAHSLISKVRRAKEGCRNNTLNSTVFRATALGLASNGVLQAFRAAAMASGLTDTEISATIYSATSSAPQPRIDMQVWRQRAVRHPDLQHNRIRVNALRVIDAVASVAACAQSGQAFGLSARDLAERTGLSKNTAARLMNRLVDCDLLRSVPWVDHSNARRYRLKIPSHSPKWDSHPLLPDDLDNLSKKAHVIDSGVGNQTLQNQMHQMQEVVRIANHRAFMKSMSMPSLGSNYAPALLALFKNPLTKTELERETSLHPNTISRHIKTLEREGLIQISGQFIRLTDPDLMSLLDQWASRNQPVDPREVQKIKHAQERSAYIEHRLPATKIAPPFIDRHCVFVGKHRIRTGTTLNRCRTAPPQQQGATRPRQSAATCQPHETKRGNQSQVAPSGHCQSGPNIRGSSEPGLLRSSSTNRDPSARRSVPSPHEPEAGGSDFDDGPPFGITEADGGVEFSLRTERSSAADRRSTGPIDFINLIAPRGLRVRARLQEHRRHPSQGRRVYVRTRLHRAILMDSLPQVPRCP